MEVRIYETAVVYGSARERTLRVPLVRGKRRLPSQQDLAGDGGRCADALAHRLQPHSLLERRSREWPSLLVSRAVSVMNQRAQP